MLISYLYLPYLIKQKSEGHILSHREVTVDRVCARCCFFGEKLCSHPRAKIKQDQVGDKKKNRISPGMSLSRCQRAAFVDRCARAALNTSEHVYMVCR